MLNLIFYIIVVIAAIAGIIIMHRINPAEARLYIAYVVLILIIGLFLLQPWVAFG